MNFSQWQSQSTTKPNRNCGRGGGESKRRALGREIAFDPSSILPFSAPCTLRVEETPRFRQNVVNDPREEGKVSNWKCREQVIGNESIGD